MQLRRKGDTNVTVDSTMGGNTYNYTKPPKQTDYTGIVRAIIGTVIVLFLLFIILFSRPWYNLSENQAAVVSTFGKPEAVTTAGMHGRIPIIQSVYKMSTEINGLALGYGDGDQTIVEESEMITSDFNFVYADFYIEYQVTDPIQYYINRDSAVTILRNLALSYIRDTVGLHTVDEVITDGKAEIQAEVRDKLVARIESENIGISVTGVLIQDTEVPEAVKDAFTAVETARTGIETKVSEANKDKSTRIPAAEQKADEAKQSAEAYKQEKISEAEGQVARFNETYEEYIKYPYVTKRRMFYETLESVLPSLKVIINGSDGTSTVLPLESFTQVYTVESSTQEVSR